MPLFIESVVIIRNRNEETREGGRHAGKEPQAKLNYGHLCTWDALWAQAQGPTPNGGQV